MDIKSAKEFKDRKTFETFFKSMAQKFDLCIFGIGALGRQIAAWLFEADIKILYAADNNPENWGGYWLNGIKILSPGELKKIKEKVYVIVAVADKQIKYNREINEQLKDFPNVFRNPLGISIYWHQVFDIEIHDIKRFYSASKAMFADAYSGRIYERLWNYRLQSEVRDYSLGELDDVYYPRQYLVSEIFDFDDIHSVVDAGAYTGDTLDDFINAGISADYYCFEMDKDIYEILKSNVADKYPDMEDRIRLFHYGLSEKKDTVHYKSDYSGGSHIDENAENVASMISLDELRDKSHIGKIDFIKMDIEGAEELALKGAINTIREDHPILAISIYHTISQFLRIPAMVKEIDDRYELYLRHHKNTMDDTVLYAVYPR